MYDTFSLSIFLGARSIHFCSIVSSFPRMFERLSSAPELHISIFFGLGAFTSSASLKLSRMQRSKHSSDFISRCLMDIIGGSHICQLMDDGRGNVDC